jgi:6-pyruvoyltetrahydropterin/6-carboxytetrahydropterin synthase
MIQLTKIFHFEMAHAIDGYPGACKNIHGHSYELHVQVNSGNQSNEYIQGIGLAIDFKDIKNIVKCHIIDVFDHHLLLSKSYLSKNAGMANKENLIAWEIEPTAENILIFIQKTLQEKMPNNCHLHQLTLFETKDSYANWQA